MYHEAYPAYQNGDALRRDMRDIPNLSVDTGYNRTVSTDHAENPGCFQKPFLYYVYILTIVLLTMCGVLFLFLSFYLYILRSDYVPLLHNQNYMFCVTLMAGAGLLILINGCLSCSAMTKRWVLCAYTMMLIVILGMQLVLCYTSFTYSQVADGDAVTNLPRDLKNYHNDSVITRAIDVLQVEGRCCGAHGFEDYKGPEQEEEDDYDVHGRRQKAQYVPDSCCRSVSDGCGRRDHPSNIYYHGCLRFLQRQVKQHTYMIFTLAFAGTILQIFAILVTCCICVRKMSKGREKKEKTRTVQGREYSGGLRYTTASLVYLE